MGKGYAEGPAAEERYEALERGNDETDAVELRPAVFASTDAEPEKHFIGWLGDVDPDELFKSGSAWGVSIRRIAAGVRP